MTIQLWQAVIGPLVITLLTLVFNGWHSSASISHQRTQRLRDLIYSGAWRTVHPMVLVMDVREAFGIQVALDPKGLRLALKHSDGAYAVLRDYLAARDFVTVCDDEMSFTRRVPVATRKDYGHWPVYVVAIGLVTYVLLIWLYAYLAMHGDAYAWVVLPIIVVCLLIAVKVAMSLRNANRLLRLPPAIEEVFPPSP